MAKRAAVLNPSTAWSAGSINSRPQARPRPCLPGLVERAYEGAKTGRRTGGWVTGGTSANAEIGVSLVALRNRSRELIRDNPTPPRPAAPSSAMPSAPGSRQRLSDGQAAWSRWCQECDADGQKDFSGLIAPVEHPLRIRRSPDPPALPPPGRWPGCPSADAGHRAGLYRQPQRAILPNGGWILNGVEFDPIGRRVAYWLYGSPRRLGAHSQSLTSRRVPAEDIIHLYEKTSQARCAGSPSCPCAAPHPGSR